MTICYIVSGSNVDIELLKRYLTQRDVILATSFATLALCKTHFSNVFSVEDFIPYSEISSFNVKSLEMNVAFTKTACEGAMLNGYNWPAIFWESQRWVLRDVLLSEALAIRLGKNDFNNIIWVGTPTSKPALYGPTLDLIASVMHFYLGDRFEVLPPSWKTRSQSKIQHYLSRIRAARSYARKRSFYQEPVITNRKIVAILNVTEWARYTEPLSELVNEFGDQFQFWVLGALPAHELNILKSKIGSPPSTIAYPDQVDSDITNFFVQYWEKWQKGNRRSFAEDTNSAIVENGVIDYQFQYYYRQLWPRIAQWARRTEQYLRRAKPDWLIASSAYGDSFPIHVANKLGVSSIALSHGYVQYADGEIYSSFLACRDQFERSNFYDSFPDDRRILFCSDAGNELSYTPRRDLTRLDTSRDRIVLVLTATPDLKGNLMSMRDRKAFWEELNELIKIPKDLSDIKLVIKSHPRADITALIQKLFLQKSKFVELIDPSAPVMEFIATAWVVVLFNHYGSVIVPAIKSEKPIIIIESAECFWPESEHFVFSSGEVVNDISSFWALLRKLQKLPEYYQELVTRCRSFKSEYLRPANQTVAQWIKAQYVLREGRDKD